MNECGARNAQPLQERVFEIRKLKAFNMKRTKEILNIIPFSLFLS